MKKIKFFVTMQAEIMVAADSPHAASIQAMDSWRRGTVPTVVTMRWGRGLAKTSSSYFTVNGNQTNEKGKRHAM